MLFPTLVAGISEGIVYADGFAPQGDIPFGDVAVRGNHLNPVVSAGLHGSGKSVYEFRAAVRIDGVVSAVIGQHNGIQLIAFCQAGRHGQHNAIAEGHHGAFHILIGIGALGNVSSTEEKIAFEILADKTQRNHQMLDTQPLAIFHRTGNLPGIVLGAVVEGDG